MDTSERYYLSAVAQYFKEQSHNSQQDSCKRRDFHEAYRVVMEKIILGMKGVRR